MTCVLREPQLCIISAYQALSNNHTHHTPTPELLTDDGHEVLSVLVQPVDEGLHLRLREVHRV